MNLLGGSELDIKELKERRKILEQNLSGVIKNIVVKFEEDTGVLVSNVDIYITHTLVCAQAEQCIVDVNVDIDF